MIDNKSNFDWINFYIELSNKLKEYRDDRKTLITKIKKIFSDLDIRLPKLDTDGIVTDVDPFTVFGLFNKGITQLNRIKILNGFAKEFNIISAPPTSFDSIPTVMNLAATFYGFVGDRQENDIDNLWQLYNYAIEYADTHSQNSKQEFINTYNAVLGQNRIKWNITMALYWIRPYDFINLDSRNRWFIRNPQNMPAGFIDAFGDIEDVPDGEKYLRISAIARDVLEHDNYQYKNLPELSYCAWVESERVNQENRIAATIATKPTVGASIGDSDVRPVHYWLYSPGDNASMWEEFYNDGIMAIGWSDIGDLRAFETKEEIRTEIKKKTSSTTSCKNAAHATWQFVHEMMPGDIVFAKKGMHRIIGRGIVSSEYFFDMSRADKYKNVRRINWTHIGNWEHPSQAAIKTLTDITPYTEYVSSLNSLIYSEDVEEDPEEVVGEKAVYTEADFLDEVFMSAEEYSTIKALIKTKKNLILQGAPGVGKTFIAKRLAYSIMGEKDLDRVMMIQFHQSYSYEDFIMGFRPSESGFKLAKGPFYNFCKKAETDKENDYYFIIDEINRGNLSKIFGELFLLIEKDKRDFPIQLLYSDEKFSVPSNVYIIGMMNTADRSLAMLDYALRRRFAFYDISPAFENNSFRQYRISKNNKKFDRLISTIEQLNIAIENDETLGRGFRIGHSFFCTDNEINDEWLLSVVNYEIIPLLCEYWFDESSKVRDWENALREAIR